MTVLNWVIFCAILGPVLGHPSPAYNHDNPSYTSGGVEWLKYVNNELLPLPRLALPGTHNSLSSKTQKYSLIAQLNIGVRVFDIHLKQNGNSLRIYHEDFDTGHNYASVLDTLVEYLVTHPTEFVILRIRDENNNGGPATAGFLNAYNSEMSRVTGRGMLWRGNAMPLLGVLRGKILVLDDFSSGGGSPVFTSHGVNYKAFLSDIQDEHLIVTPLELYDKWEAVKKHALSGCRDTTICINYLSGYGGVTAERYFVASGHITSDDDSDRAPTGLIDLYLNPINLYPDFPRTNCVLLGCLIHFEGINILYYNHIGYQRGIVMMDFPGEKLVERIFNWNPLFTPSTTVRPTTTVRSTTTLKPDPTTLQTEIPLPSTTLKPNATVQPTDIPLPSTTIEPITTIHPTTEYPGCDNDDDDDEYEEVECELTPPPSSTTESSNTTTSSTTESSSTTTSSTTESSSTTTTTESTDPDPGDGGIGIPGCPGCPGPVDPDPTDPGGEIPFPGCPGLPFCPIEGNSTTLSPSPTDNGNTPIPITAKTTEISSHTTQATTFVTNPGSDSPILPGCPGLPSCPAETDGTVTSKTAQPTDPSTVTTETLSDSTLSLSTTDGNVGMPVLPGCPGLPNCTNNTNGNSVTLSIQAETDKIITRAASKPDYTATKNLPQLTMHHSTLHTKSAIVVSRPQTKKSLIYASWFLPKLSTESSKTQVDHQPTPNIKALPELPVPYCPRPVHHSSSKENEFTESHITSSINWYPQFNYTFLNDSNILSARVKKECGVPVAGQHILSSVRDPNMKLTIQYDHTSWQPLRAEHTIRKGCRKEETWRANCIGTDAEEGGIRKEIEDAYPRVNQATLFAGFRTPPDNYWSEYVTKTCQKGSRFFSKGHLCPAPDINDKEITFFYINATPQWQKINNGVWKIMEGRVRELSGVVRVITGTKGVLTDYCDRPLYLLGDRLPVPLYLWKIVYLNNQFFKAVISINDIYDPYRRDIHNFPGFQQNCRTDGTVDEYCLHKTAAGPQDNPPISRQVQIQVMYCCSLKFMTDWLGPGVSIT